MFTGNRWISNSSRALRAFTLIELLVVVAIISLLAAILFPVFARARENARRASCLSNIKQMGLAMMQYVQDYDETYPFSEYPAPVGTLMPDGQIWAGSAANPYLFWPQMLYPYHKSVQMFWCPSSSIAYNSAEGNPVPVNGQYGANASVLPEWTPSASTVKMSSINSASTTYMIMDSGNYVTYQVSALSGSGTYYLPGIGDGGGNCSGSSSPALLEDDCRSGRHFGGVNVGFADGHAKWLKSSVLVAEARKGAPNQYGAWNPAN